MNKLVEYYHQTFAAEIKCGSGLDTMLFVLDMHQHIHHKKQKPLLWIRTFTKYIHQK